MSSIGVLRGAPGTGYASDGSGLYYALAMGPVPGQDSAIIIFLLNPTYAIQFTYSLSGPPKLWGGKPIEDPNPHTMLTLTAPAPAGVDGTLSLYTSNDNGIESLIFGWCIASGSTVTDAGMEFDVITAGALALGPDGLTDGESFIYSGGSKINLDFSWVDLSGEDYSSATLAANERTASDDNVVLVSSLWSYADLSNTNFTGNTITNATFDNAVLNGTTFNGATLVNATFNGASGASPDFSGATLAAVSFANTLITTPVFDNQTVFSSQQGDADFSNATWSDTVFSGCDLRGIHFNNSNLTGAKFNNAFLDGAVFDGATLGNADFTGASLLGTLFTNTDVTQATFSSSAQFSTDPKNRTSFAGSKIPGAGFNQFNWAYLDLSGATFDSKPATIANLNAQWAILAGMDFSKTTFTATDPVNAPTTFANAVLAQSDFSGADLENAVFSSANGEANSDPTRSYTLAAVFTGANLRDAQFDSALLAGVDFSYALLWGSVTFASATLLDTIFANAYLPGAQFTGLKGGQCGGLVFTGACLINASFESTTLQDGSEATPVLFDGAFLQGADFGGSTLSAVNFTGAVLSTEPGKVAVVFSAPPPGTKPGLFPLSYAATTIDPSQTNSGTFCVDGGNGPCSAARLAPPSPMPTTWTQESIVLTVDG
jgi:uncharacterized protein YjbI with pentapeptide repeats